MIEVGQFYTVKCPFQRIIFREITEDGYIEHASWRPGVSYKQDEYGGERTYCHADGEGLAIFECIAVCVMPRPLKDRVFFRRSFETPDGKRFGRADVRVATEGKFKQLISRWGPTPGGWVVI